MPKSDRTTLTMSPPSGFSGLLIQSNHQQKRPTRGLRTKS